MPKKLPIRAITWWLRLMLVGVVLSLATPIAMLAVDANWPQYKHTMYYVDKFVGFYIHTLVWGALISLWLYLEILVFKDGKFHLRESLANIKGVWQGKAPATECKFEDNAPERANEKSDR